MEGEKRVDVQIRVDVQLSEGEKTRNCDRVLSLEITFATTKT